MSQNDRAGLNPAWPDGFGVGYVYCLSLILSALFYLDYLYHEY